MNDLLNIQNISLKRGSRSVLSGLTLSVNSGDRIVIKGDNGSGKTSLLKAILGLLPLEDGSICLENRIVGSREWQDIRRKTAWMPQDGVLHRFPVSTEEAVSVGLAGVKLSRRERTERVRTAMADSGAEHLSGRCFHRLSGGERQRVSLARCLAQGAELLLLDEPATALDASSRTRFISRIEDLGIKAVIAVTHEDGLFSTDRWTHLNLDGGRLC